MVTVITGSYKTADLTHELLHVLFLLENKRSQIIEWNVGLHILGKAMIFHIDLRNKLACGQKGQYKGLEWNKFILL